MPSDFENGRFYPNTVVSGGRSARDKVIADMQASLNRIEQKQDSYSAQLTDIQHQISSRLELVAHNTTAMNNSLHAIQTTNSKLVDVISSRQVVPTIVLIIIVVLLAGIFLTRELAVTGGRAKFSLDGLDISSGNRAVLDFKQTPTTNGQ